MPNNRNFNARARDLNDPETSKTVSSIRCLSMVKKTSRRISRTSSSLMYYLRKSYWKISTAKPSYFLIAVLLMGFVIFLLGGGIYDLLQNPLAVFPMRGRIIFYYPYYLHDQSLNESIGVMIMYTLGTLGLLLVYQSTKYAHTPRHATIMLIIGIVFLILAFITVEAIIYWKMHFTA